MKKSDIILLSIMISVFLGSILAYFTSSWIIGLLSIMLFCTIICIGFMLIKKKNNYISRDDFVNNLLLLGKEKSNQYIKRLYPDIVEADGNMIIQNETLISNCIKYSALGEEDVAVQYRTCKKLGLSKIIIFTNYADKKAMNLSFRLDIPTTVYPMKKLYSLLKTKRILENKSTAVLKKRGIANILNNLAYVPIKYFALSSISTALLSFVVPMKIYYLIFALINALLGIIVFFLSKRQSA